MNPFKKFILDRAYKKKKAEMLKVYPDLYQLIVAGLKSDNEVEFSKSKYFLKTFLVENEHQELLDQWIKDSCEVSFGRFIEERRGPKNELEKDNLRGCIEYHLLMRPVPKGTTINELWTVFPPELLE